MNKDALKITCERIVALDDFEINMANYIDTHDNVTSYCIAGRLAYLDEYPEEYMVDGVFDNSAYIWGRLFGVVNDNYDINQILEIKLWLFATKWPDSLEHAKARAQKLLDNECNYNYRFFKGC